MNQADLLLPFLTHLHRGGSWAYWWILEGKRTIWWPVGKPLPCPSGRVNAYFGVHPSSNPKSSRNRAKSTDIAAVNCLFADLDGKRFDRGKRAAWSHVELLDPPPSVIVDSGGGYHAYWLLAEPFLLATAAERERARRLQAGWAALVGGDNGAKDLTRVLRVPGTTNYKPDYAPDFPQVQFVKADLDWLYDLEALAALIPTPCSEARSHKTTHSGNTLRQAASAAKALERLSQARCDDYQSWVLVGMALSELSETGLALWRQWSQKSAKYQPGACEVKWPTFTPADGVTLGSLFHWANEDDPPVRTAGVSATPTKPETSSTAGKGQGLSAQEQTLLSFDADDEGNVQGLKYLYGDRFLHCEAYGWMYYTGTHWEREKAEAKLERAIVDTLQRRRLAAVQAGNESLVKAAKPSAHHVRSAKYLLTSLLAVSVHDLDASPNHLNVKNGVLDLRTGELIAHDPSQLFTYCLPVEYDPYADTAEWERWLLGAVGGDDSVTLYLQAAVGYTLTGHIWEECFFYIYGPTRAGKGTFTETLLALMGREPLAIETDFATFTRKRENDTNNADLAKLKPCRLVVASESAKHEWINAAKTKQVTGGNEIFCAFKYGDHFSYRPQYAIWLVSNHAPKIDVDDDAAWARIRVIRFPNSYLGREDKRLKAKMKKPAMLRRVLAWAVRGAMMWYEAEGKGLIAPPRIEEETQAARDLLDFVGQWLTERVEKTDDPKHFVSNPTLYADYKQWCEANGVTPRQIATLTQTLKIKGYRAGERGRIGGKQYRGCYGIQLVQV
jgi:P4 family phage/plasmid primase-like protien